jgi:hypothetical protein
MCCDQFPNINPKLATTWVYASVQFAAEAFTFAFRYHHAAKLPATFE